MRTCDPIVSLLATERLAAGCGSSHSGSRPSTTSTRATERIANDRTAGLPPGLASALTKADHPRTSDSPGPTLTARFDRGDELPAGSAAEPKLRACAVHGCELLTPITGPTARELDNVAWTRGQGADYASTPPQFRSRLETR